ncbi:hypothetical protein ACOSQ2_022919 [Xanthoceras sorbifolium]
MEKITIHIKLIDNFRREGDTLPLDYHRPPCKEIVWYHRGIKLPYQSRAGIIGILHKAVSLPGPDNLRNYGPIHFLNVNTAL